MCIMPVSPKHKPSFSKGTRVTWVDGIGFEHKGIIAYDTDKFIIPVKTQDGEILRIKYSNLHVYVDDNP